MPINAFLPSYNEKYRTQEIGNAFSITARTSLLRYCVGMVRFLSRDNNSVWSIIRKYNKNDCPESAILIPRF